MSLTKLAIEALNAQWLLKSQQIGWRQSFYQAVEALVDDLRKAHPAEAFRLSINDHLRPTITTSLNAAAMHQAMTDRDWIRMCDDLAEQTHFYHPDHPTDLLTTEEDIANASPDQTAAPPAGDA